MKTPDIVMSHSKHEAHRQSFVLTFSIAATVVYLVCEIKNWPLFTYHPGPSQFDWFYAPAMRDLGPAMYWYGWTANALIGGAAVGMLSVILPANWTRRIPPTLVWLLPALSVPWLVHALNFYWR